MTQFYPRQCSSPTREVFNYPLPDDFYRSNCRASHAQYMYNHPDSMPRNMFINPQQLVMATSPLSMMSADEYSFPTVPHPRMSQSSMDNGDSMDYMGPSPSTHVRLAPGDWYHGGNQRSYTLERSPGQRPSRSYGSSSTSYQTSLLTPPHSPTETIANRSPTTTTINMSPSSYTDNHTHAHTHNNYHNPTNTMHAPALSVSLSQQTNTPSSRFFCTHDDCLDQNGKSKKSFSRRADLQRHHTSTHESIELHSCPRPNCSRKGEQGFTRLDHLIEHRRGYHGEKIPKRGGRGSGEGSRRRSA